MKKILLFAVIAISLMACNNEPNATIVVDGLEYTLNYETKTAEVSARKEGRGNWNKSLKEANIQEYVRYEETDYLVVGIRAYGFQKCTALQYVYIPNTIKYISEWAFADCTSLKRVVIPKEIQCIEDYTFYHCVNLESVVLGENVTVIGGAAFSECSSLQSITFPDKLTKIYEYAFSDCDSLQSVSIPKSVGSIGVDVFGGCSNLVSIIVDEENSVYDSRNNCNAIVETATNVLMVGCRNTIIPNDISKIGGGAFYGCNGLTSVTIPRNVVFIGHNAFATSDVDSVIIEEGVAEIGYGAFSRCPELKSILIPNSVTHIWEEAFYGCVSLQSISIPNGVNYIGFSTFEKCESLQSVYLPNSITSIHESAFSGCASLTSVAIPDSVTFIGRDAFEGCVGLTSVTCYAVTPPTMCTYEENPIGSVPRVFSGVYCSKLTLYVPSESVEAYKSTKQWKDFGTILPL